MAKATKKSSHSNSASMKSPAKSSTGNEASKKGSSSRDSLFAEADAVMKKAATKKNVQEAAAIYDEVLAKNPEDAEAHWRKARAYITVLEKETGTVLIERKEYFAVLDEMGKLALESATRAYDLDPADIDCVGWLLVSYGYHSVSIGVVRAVLGGAASRYLKLAQEVLDLNPSWHSGAADRALGRFYREAPWPKRDLKRSISHFRKALEHAPKRLENKLHLALALADNGDREEAKELLEVVIKGKPEPTEKHFYDLVNVFAKGKRADL